MLQSRPAGRSVVGRSVAGNDDTSSGRVGSSHIDDLAAAVQVTLPERFKSRKPIAHIHRARRNCNTKDKTGEEGKRGNGGREWKKETALGQMRGTF